jgi:threonine dehydratase
MQVNADGSKLAQALALATDASMPNGYDLLHVLLKTLIPAFDDEVLEITWPKYSEFSSILEFATAVEQTALLATKRQQAVSEKNYVLQFLNGVISGANQDYRLQAQIIKTDLTRHPNNTVLPPRFKLKKLAFEITKAWVFNVPCWSISSNWSRIFHYKSIKIMNLSP